MKRKIKEGAIIQKIILSNDNSFKLIKPVRNKINKKTHFKFQSKRKKTETDKIEIIDLERKPKKIGKFKKFFIEPSFNMIEMLITLIVVCSVVAFGIIFIKNKELDNNENESLNGYESITDEKLVEFIDLYTDITENYYDSIDSDELLDKITEAMVEYLGDAYTGYMDKSESRELQDRLNGKYDGIGVEISTTEDGKIVVTKVFEGSPASKVDIQIGDVIKEVSGIDVTTKDASELSLLVKESLSGILSVVVERDSEEKTIYVEKGNVIIDSVTTEIFGNVGYLKIDTFSTSAINQTENALLYLESQGIKSLIVDVRYNTGGYLTSAQSISDLFLEKGRVIYQLKNNKGTETYKALSSTKRNYRVAVLINGTSASASEMFALAMRDSYGATLVGAKSYGKGTVQQTTELSTGSLVKFTVANWLSPYGESINEKGITPDISADMGADYLKDQTYENDGQLQAAIKAIK